MSSSKVTSPPNVVKLALPKGSLQRDTAEFFARAGYRVQGYDDSSRGYRPTVLGESIETKVLRPQEIPMYVAEGVYDAGISGLDWLLETQSYRDVETVDLRYGRVDIVLAVHESLQDVKSAEDLLSLARTRSGIRIATEYLNLTEQMVLQVTGDDPTVVTPWRSSSKHRESPVTIFLSFGATEGKPPEDADAIVDNTATGKTLAENGLRIVHYLLRDSTARLIISRRALADKRKHPLLELLQERFRETSGASKARRPGLALHVEP